MPQRKTWKRFYRFSLRRLLVLVTLFACLCWFASRWGQVLVVLDADRVLVPLGIGVYSEHAREHEDLLGVKVETGKAVWISNQSCGKCHKAGRGFNYRIAFPHKGSPD